jgi:antitoxin component YwqK of YwqJK toxin-antitoxin module
MDGPWEAWEDGHLQISGNYRSGKQHGPWKYYNHDGSVAHILDYEDGIKTSDNLER